MLWPRSMMPLPTPFFWPKHLWNKIIKFNKIFPKIWHFCILPKVRTKLLINPILIVHTIKAIDSQKPNRMILCLTSLCCFCWQGFLFFILTAIFLPEDFHRFILKCTANITADISKRWGDNNYLNKVENEFLILLGFFTPNNGIRYGSYRKMFEFFWKFRWKGKNEKYFF